MRRRLFRSVPTDFTRDVPLMIQAEGNQKSPHPAFASHPRVRLALACLALLGAASCGGSAKRVTRIPETIAARSARTGVTILGDDGLFAEVLVAEGAPLLITDLRAHGGAPVLRPDLRSGDPVDTSVSRDHPYQRGLRVAYGDVNGHDLWTTNESAIVQRTSLDMPADGRAIVAASIDWRAPDGTLLCSETRRTSFASFRDVRFVDVAIRLEATGDGVTFGDTKDGLMALRLSDALAPSSSADARSFDSEGRSGTDIWGQEARWVAHAGSIAGEDGEPGDVTVALLDHPENRLSPCRWHVRAYGIMAANPFGLSAFDGTVGDRGRFTIQPYGVLELRYRVVVAGSALSPEELDALWREFGGIETQPEDAAENRESTGDASAPIEPDETAADTATDSTEQ